MTPCGPAAALTDGVGSPGLAPEEEAARVCCCSVDEDEDEAFCVAVADWSLPARRPASLRARSSVWDIVTRSEVEKREGELKALTPTEKRERVMRFFGSPTVFEIFKIEKLCHTTTEELVQCCELLT